MKLPKSKKAAPEDHCANAKIGMGDFYGTGVKNPVGRIRDSYTTTPVAPGKVKTPPKSLA